MPGLLTISLNKIRFYGQHGLYAEERKVGNEFEIDLHVHYHTDESVIHTKSSRSDIVLYPKCPIEFRVFPWCPLWFFVSFVIHLSRIKLNHKGHKETQRTRRIQRQPGGIYTDFLPEKTL